MTDIYWIKRELDERFPGLRPEQGADLDGDGAIAGPEITDRDGDGRLSVEEWREFLADNAAALKALGGFFSIYYSHGARLSVDNPIHDILQVESKATTESETAGVYSAMDKLIDTFSRYEITGGTPASLARIKMQMLYSALRSTGFTDGAFYYEPMLTTAVADKVLDCDSSAYLVMGAAHEFGWPVGIVPLPHHLFLRYDDGNGIRFNVDMGSVESDRYYMDLFGIDRRAVNNGVFLTALGRAYIVSNALMNRASYRLFDEGDIEQSLEDLEEAIRIAPKNTLALTNHITALMHLAGDSSWFQGIKEDLAGRLGRPRPKPRLAPDGVKVIYEKALAENRRLESLEHRKEFTTLNRARIHSALGKNKLALAECKKALAIDSAFDDFTMRKADVHRSLAYITSRMGDPAKAMAHAEQAIAMSRGDDEMLASAYATRGDMRANAGMYDAAMEDYDLAIRLDADNWSIRIKRSAQLYKLERFDEAVAEIKRAIKSRPTIEGDLLECIEMIDGLKERKRWREKSMKMPCHYSPAADINMQMEITS